MADTVRHRVDSSQVTKAIQALYAYHNTKKRGDSLLLNEHERISLIVTVWRIPDKAEVIRIPVPHSIRPRTQEVCLFTRDEPNMSTEQTINFYKKLLSNHGVTQISEIIPLRKMKREYKPFEAKRRLLRSFGVFLADARIRRLLPSQMGKHFYKSKKEAHSVNLERKSLKFELNRFIQASVLHITNKGCCYSILVGHTGMKVEEIVENVLAVTKVLTTKLPMNWCNVKILHLKTQSSVALPIYNSSFDNLNKLGKSENPVKKEKSAKKRKAGAEEDGTTTQKEINKPDEEEEIPELVPIEEPSSAKKSKKKHGPGY
ncbi:hypothetical protein GDO81_016936 [Engystomops pustulosus]|uniref:Ribosomal L1 domain-containing protein 1 n=1 Tax=Engystomops pustulosus TaxID=76066 RepID=A0AAV7ABU1_ENGPU|nr:hypothetical protein GDO81_016936 [Engystomops pustulosus]